MTKDKLVSDFVVERPSRARGVKQFVLDYCCGGRQPLAQACRELGLDPEAVFARLLEHDAASDPEPPDLDGMNLAEVCDEIEKVHHSYLKRELPRISDLAARVVEAHAEADPRWRDVQAVFERLRSELESHLWTEEQILFPAIRTLAAAEAAPQFPFGALSNPISVMEAEHDSAGAALAELRGLTGGYQPPPDACPTTLALLDALQTLEADTHRHIHRENNILHRRALERWRTLQG